MMRRRRNGGLLWGVALIAFGVLFLARNLGYIDFHFTWHIYWPLLLVIMGLSMLANSFTRSNSEHDHREG